MVLVHAYLIVCLLILLSLVIVALGEDIRKRYHGFKFDPAKATQSYQIMNPFEYCVPNYRNPVFYGALFVLATPIVNLLLLLGLLVFIFALKRSKDEH